LSNIGWNYNLLGIGLLLMRWYSFLSLEISPNNFLYVIDSAILNFTPQSTDPEEEDEHAIGVGECCRD
jgi:hypothetical protein